MLHSIFQNQSIYDWVIFPVLIFCSRLADVSLGTLRSVLASKGKKKIVPFIGFFEVLLWLLAISQIMQNLTNVMCYLAWAGGYAMGSYLGLTIEEKLAIGLQVVRIITNQNSDEFIKELRTTNHGVTVIDGQGSRGPVKMIFTIVNRKEVSEVIQLINEHNLNSFYSVEDVKDASQVSYGGRSSRLEFFSKLLPFRKEK